MHWPKESLYQAVQLAFHTIDTSGFWNKPGDLQVMAD